MAEGMKAQAAAKLKEAENEAKLQTALTGRADALRRLRDASSNRGAVPFTPQPAAGANLCYDRAALESALQRFTTDLQGLIDEGDTALINSRAWAGAWPK